MRLQTGVRYTSGSQQAPACSADSFPCISRALLSPPCTVARPILHRAVHGATKAQHVKLARSEHKCRAHACAYPSSCVATPCCAHAVLRHANVTIRTSHDARCNILHIPTISNPPRRPSCRHIQEGFPPADRDPPPISMSHSYTIKVLYTPNAQPGKQMLSTRSMGDPRSKLAGSCISISLSSPLA